MIRTTRTLTAVMAVAALSVVASPNTAAAQAPKDPAMAALYSNWQGQIDFITKAAEEMTEANYAYKPVATVRSFGELIGHVAGTQDMICAAVLGEKQPAEDAIEKTAKTKAALVAALKASTAHCMKAYNIPAASGTAMVDMFGSKSTKIAALALNAVHDGEHYGNIVTYMRMKGMVPPSSKR
ncbi:DinB family protein [Gemmatimonas groenlandica]|uniref:DinB family protein n=1 Tax=Gemmatimonas groenlandica TaxID=2732249 RepID=A0A6M4IPC8_9BACT|nr:DinB family protein [Gemmatimonas groenlandica]QJR36794.1 DinB family protein [Gemmatimonas groenlandica]